MIASNHFPGLELQLAASRLKWETEFPIQTAALDALREALIASETAALHARAVFHNFHLLTEATGIDMHLWEPKLLRHFTYLKHRHAEDSRHFTRALQALQSAYAAHQKAAAAIAPPPEPPPVANKPRFMQTIEVKVIDGVVTGVPDYDAAFFLKNKLQDLAHSVTRQFYFENAVVPEPYAYVLTDLGVTHAPVEYVSITYAPDEFARLCRLEIETASPYLLDGERSNYWLEEIVRAPLRPPYEETPKEN